MKRLLFLIFLLIHATAGGIEKGMPRKAVLTELGEPRGSMQRDGKEILLFETGTVTLQNGRVSEIALSPEYAKQAEERALKAKELKLAKLVELEKQKLLYPEDRVIQTGCPYNKTENWDYLPESIRPAQGEYGYDVYIPQGYHQSADRLYTCLFLESPALWDSVKERVRKEKWIVVILHNTVQQQAGKTLNGSFVSAFDDATGRFRISKEHIFIAGRIPTAIFATMRPVAGIILQEPDFSGIQRLGITLDFLRKNKNLRAYVLLGDQNRANVDYQAQFITAKIPQNCIGIYQGNTDVMPKPLADRAFDWMKKEYSLP